MTSCCSGQILELTAESENLQQTHFDVDDVADIRLRTEMQNTFTQYHLSSAKK